MAVLIRRCFLKVFSSEIKKKKSMGCSNSRSAVKLTDEDVQFLMKNTSYTEKEIRDWYKGFQVDCPDGKLSRDKFIDIYKNFFKGGNPEKFCEHVYRTFDEDGNGSIGNVL